MSSSPGEEPEDLDLRMPLMRLGVIGDRSNSDKEFSSEIGMTSAIQDGSSW